MKKINLIILSISAFLYFNFTTIQSAKEMSCSVIVFNDNWLIKSYKKGEKAVISKQSTGTLSVHETGDVSKNSFKKNKLKFKIAIQRKMDDTFISFSDKVYDTIQASQVLEKCLIGDKIVIILADLDNYSLPHNIIEVI